MLPLLVGTSGRLMEPSVSRDDALPFVLGRESSITDVLELTAIGSYDFREWGSIVTAVLTEEAELGLNV